MNNGVITFLRQNQSMGSREGTLGAARATLGTDSRLQPPFLCDVMVGPASRLRQSQVSPARC